MATVIRRSDHNSVHALLARHLRRLRAEDAGTVALEYAIMGAGIAVAIAVVVFAVGTELLPKYEEINTGFTALQGG